MGEVKVEVELENYDDRVLAVRNYLSAEDVRSHKLRALVDSGAVMLVFALFYSIYYLLLRLGEPALGEMAHSAGHVAMVISHVLLALLLIEASKSPAPVEM